MQKHCPTCTCQQSPLERLVERLGQVEAAKKLGCSQGNLSHILTGPPFARRRLLMELLATNFEKQQDEAPEEEKPK